MLKKTLTSTLIILAFFTLHLNAQTHIHGIADVTLNCFLGGTTDALWHSADFAIYKISLGSQYRIYTLTEELPSAKCTEIWPFEEGGPYEPNQIVLSPEPVSSQPMIAISGAWNALPRIPKQMTINNSFILEDIKRIFEEHQLDQMEPHIVTSYKIDLEGDGEEEWLVTLSNQTTEPSAHAKKGDYAFALLGKWIDAHPVHFVIASEIHQLNAEWGAPNQFHIRAVLDTNGDGNQEIFIYTKNYEAGVTSIHRYTDGQVYELLRAGWAN